MKKKTAKKFINGRNIAIIALGIAVLVGVVVALVYKDANLFLYIAFGGFGIFAIYEVAVSIVSNHTQKRKIKDDLLKTKVIESKKDLKIVLSHYKFDNQLTHIWLFIGNSMRPTIESISKSFFHDDTELKATVTKTECGKNIVCRTISIEIDGNKFEASNLFYEIFLDEYSETFS